MSGRQPNWDIDRASGATAELWIDDIRAVLTEGTLEVKRDVRAMTTGNLYIEYECLRRGRYEPSGISTTRADAWVIVLEESALALVIETSFLKLLCGKPGVRTREERDGSHPTKGYLLPLTYLVRPADRPAHERCRGAL